MKTQQAIVLAGTAKALAELFGITASAVSQWGEDLPDGRVWQLRVLQPGWFDQTGKAVATQSQPATQATEQGA